ncbi:MAG: glycoside hydrolase family 65 [delta proteobacterium ML8_F1]|nr:MAG: glycoside hydrolase family 65 [delta proteobacterium ML8_F1]
MKQRPRIYEVTDFVLDNYHIQLHETLFHNANGYIGLRYDFEEGYPEEYEPITSQYINGFYDYAPIPQPENLYGLVREKQLMPDIANTQTIRLSIDNESFSLFTGTVLKLRLSLDMDRGVTLRHVHWRSPKGHEVVIDITRMASFHQLSLFTIEYAITPLNFSGTARVESGHDVDVENYYDPSDPRNANEQARHIHPLNCEIRDETSYITAVTSKSGLEVTSCVQHLLPEGTQPEFWGNHQATLTRFDLELKESQTVTFVKYAVFADSLRHDNPKNHAAEEMVKAMTIPLSELYLKQEEYLEQYWKNCLVEIDGDDEANLALSYNLYQLIQSAGKDSFSNIATKGLSGEGYEGQYFWDTEIYIQPFFTVTNPAISRQLIGYRYHTLDMARENARILGHPKGALYPWRTITGREASGFFPAGSAQYHINADIAYAIIAYYLATNDLDLVLLEGAEIILETARIWLSTGNFTDGHFNLYGVTGPDEYTCLVNNNYYTNVMAKYHLEWAVTFHELLRKNPAYEAMMERIELGETEIESFRLAALEMLLPYDRQLNINPQDDAFLKKPLWNKEEIPKENYPLLLHYHPLHLYRHQICKQADTVLAHFLLEDAQPEDVMKDSFNYYARITTHDSSLSRSIFSIMAARLGMEDEALEYFGDSIKLDLMDLQHNTKDGIHTANMAGNYLAIVYGFAGLRLKVSGLSLRPMLPASWRGYRFNLRYRDSRLCIEVDQKNCTITLVEGSPKTIRVHDETCHLEDSLVFPMK